MTLTEWMRLRAEQMAENFVQYQKEQLESWEADEAEDARHPE